MLEPMGSPNLQLLVQVLQNHDGYPFIDKNDKFILPTATALLSLISFLLVHFLEITEYLSYQHIDQNVDSGISHPPRLDKPIDFATSHCLLIICLYIYMYIIIMIIIISSIIIVIIYYPN